MLDVDQVLLLLIGAGGADLVVEFLQGEVAITRCWSWWVRISATLDVGRWTLVSGWDCWSRVCPEAAAERNQLAGEHRTGEDRSEARPCTRCLRSKASPAVQGVCFSPWAVGDRGRLAPFPRKGGGMGTSRWQS